MPSKKVASPKLTREWRVPHAATFSSPVRSHGILLEILARLPSGFKKSLGIHNGVLTLKMPEDEAASFAKTGKMISKAIEGIERLPIIPREIEDILGIKSSERHRWLKDGRLKSAGTRTVRLRGRAREVTFHVYKPLYVADLLDTDQVSAWREDDAIAKAEKRTWAAEKRRLKVQAPLPGQGKKRATGTATGPELEGWAEFERQGLLK